MVLDGDDEAMACQKKDVREPFASALAHYHTGAFLVAAEQFECCLQGEPRHGASALYAQRCRELGSKEVANWDGVTVLSSKCLSSSDSATEPR